MVAPTTSTATRDPLAGSISETSDVQTSAKPTNPALDPKQGLEYTIQGGNTLDVLAAKFQTTRAAFIQANPFLEGRPNLIHTGSKLNIPRDATVPPELSTFVGPRTTSFTAQRSPDRALQGLNGGGKSPAAAQAARHATPITTQTAAAAQPAARAAAAPAPKEAQVSQSKEQVAAAGPECTDAETKPDGTMNEAPADYKKPAPFALEDAAMPNRPSKDYWITDEPDITLSPDGVFTATFSTAFKDQGGYNITVRALPGNDGKTTYAASASSVVFGFLDGVTGGITVSPQRQYEMTRMALTAGIDDPRMDSATRKRLTSLRDHMSPPPATTHPATEGPKVASK